MIFADFSAFVGLSFAVCHVFFFQIIDREDTEAVVRDVCLETAKTEENVRKYIKVRGRGASCFFNVLFVKWLRLGEVAVTLRVAV